MQTILTVLAFILVAFIIISIYARIKMKNIAKVPESEKIITLTDKNFNQELKNKKVLVDFWAEWCGPCKMMAPILNNLAEELPVGQAVGKLNVENYQAIAQKYQVRSIPTMVLFDNGKEINRFVGVKSKDFLKKNMQ